MRILLILILLTGCANIQDNTTTGDKLIISGALLTMGIFIGAVSN
jgi:hypothetical protein|tara:strand:- start:174 stop:308 length:135 start_codon:yes stop_codon:yes gene_type:complete